MADFLRAMDTAIDIVEDRVDYLNQTAAQFNATLTGALNALSGIHVASVSPPTRPEAPEAPKLNISSSSPPTATLPGYAPPGAPSGIDLGGLLEALDVGDLDLPDAPAMPVLNMPAAPVMASVPVPVRPSIDTQVDIPDAPSITMPTMEALEQITIPAFTFPQLPDFNEQPPSVSGITVPNVFINWSEPVYQSEILDDLTQWVKTYMRGGTGLPASVEDALFSRARERDSAEGRRALQEAVDTWAARGFLNPPGMLEHQRQMLAEQARLKAAELNRDVLVEAAKWEIENIRFAVQQGIALEQLLENMHQNLANRLFEAAKFQAEAQISVFNAQIGLFNAQNQAFATLAQVYRTRLDGALAKLTAYKTAVDAQVALGQINQQKVEVFKAKLTAVQASVEVFTSLMRGAQVRSDVIKNQFDAYRADVQAFAEQINAEKVKFEAYESQVKGQTAIAGMFEASARAYAATVQGIASKADVKVKSGQLRIEAARAKVQKYSADTDRYRADLAASLQQVQYAVEVFKAQTDAWRAGAQTNLAEAEMHSRFADMQTRTNIAYSEMQIKEYESKLQEAYHHAQIALEAAKAMGQYSAQLAAGAMSALHVSASVNGSGSQSDSYSESRSTSTSTSHNYSY